MDALQTVTLRNGEKAQLGLVHGVWLGLHALWGSGDNLLNVLAFYELVQMARDSSYQISDDSRQILRDRALLDEVNRIRSGTKDIILSAAEGSEGDLGLVNPIAS